MERVCFTLNIRSDRLEAYRHHHEAVWPAMQDALRTAGWTNYSLFLRGDGLAIGYLETLDFARSLEQMDNTHVNTEWQNQMAPLVLTQPGRRADQSLDRVTEIFHLS